MSEAVVIKDQNAYGVTEWAPGKCPIIRNLLPGLPEFGKIKIGLKGEQRQKRDRSGTYQLPKKLGHFIITTLERGDDGNFKRDEELHKQLGDAPMVIPIRLLYNDIYLNYQSRYACFQGKKCYCTGDGAQAFRLKDVKGSEREEVPCPCDRASPDFVGDPKCKINSRLSCMIDGVNKVGGVWTFRTTGYWSTKGMLGSLLLIRRITGGCLAGVPLQLRHGTRTGSDHSGNPVNIPVVTVNYPGTVEQLREIGLETARSEALHLKRVEYVEKEALKMITADGIIPEHEPDEVTEIQEEFHPDETETGKAPALETTGKEPDPKPKAKADPKTEKPKNSQASAADPQEKPGAAKEATEQPPVTNPPEAAAETESEPQPESKEPPKLEGMDDQPEFEWE